MNPVFELTKDNRLVRVVQQYFNTPLNPSVLSTASSVTVVPLTSEESCNSEGEKSKPCLSSQSSTLPSPVIEPQSGNAAHVIKSSNFTLMDQHLQTFLNNVIQDPKMQSVEAQNNVTLQHDQSRSSSASMLVTQKVYRKLCPKRAPSEMAQQANNVKLTDIDVVRSENPNLLQFKESVAENDSTDFLLEVDETEISSSTTPDVESELAEYCLVDCNDGEYALMPTSSKMHYAYETPKSHTFNEIWQLPSDICRICARRSENNEQIFSKKSEKLKILDMIQNHLPIMVSRQDVLPLKICRICISSLQVADKLVKTCVAADKTLRTLLEHVCKISLPGTSTSKDAKDGHANVLIECQQHDASGQTPHNLKKMPNIKKNSIALDQEPMISHSGHVNASATNDHTYVSTPPAKVEDRVPLSQLLSEKDITAIKEMKAEGLKVTLVRLPKLSNLSEKSKHKTVMEVLKTLKTNPALKKMKKTKSKVIVVAGSTISSVTSTAAKVNEFQRDCVEMMEENESESADVSIAEDDIANPSAKEGANELSTQCDNLNWVEELGIFDSVFKNQRNAPIKTNSDGSKGADSNDGSVTIASCTFTKEEKDEIRNKVLAAHAAKLMRKQMKGKKKDPAYKEKIRKLIQEKLEKIKQLDSRSVLFNCHECNFSCGDKEELTNHKMSHFQCKYCDKLFKTRVYLTEHERVHTKEKPFVCEQCGLRFRTKQQMREHAQRHNPDKPYECEVCERRFSVRTTYKAHVQRHNTESPYLCELCGKSFKLQSGLRFHKLSHRTFNCTICNKSFSYRALQLHKKTHSGEGFFPCPACGKQFLSNQRLKIHSIIHEGTYPYCCGVCHRSFKRMTHLQAHRKRHASQLLEGMQYYKCAVCNESFNEGGKLSSHVQSHSCEERLSTKAFKCSKCSKCFSEELERQTHEQLHSEVQHFSCGKCKQFFDSKEELDKHASDHSEERPFACDVCGKRFQKQVNLNNHKPVHLSAKPFTCEVCDKSFKTINGLNQHKVVHSDIRKFSCLLCKMSFKRRDALKNHERTHFTERPYMCSVCSRSFKVKSDCATHLRRHRLSGVEGSVIESYYNCPACSEIFTLKVDLTNHVRSSHELDVSMLSIDEDNDSLLSEEALVSQESSVF